MLGFLKKHKKAFISTVVALCFAIMGVTAFYRFNPTMAENVIGFVVTPVQGFFNSIGDWVSDKVDFLMSMSELHDENKRLKEEIEQLKEDNLRLEYVEKERSKYYELYDVDMQYPDLPKVAADIRAVDPGNWYFKYTINKGENHGFKKDMIVLTAGGLAGRVYEVGATYSKVVSLIDDTSSVSARSDRTGDTGFVKGDTHLMMEGLCRMELIESDADIIVGDVIRTGQLSSIYPPGILIGEVIEIRNDPVGTKTAIVRPYVSFKKMETVLVVTELFGQELIEGTEP